MNVSVRYGFVVAAVLFDYHNQKLLIFVSAKPLCLRNFYRVVHRCSSGRRERLKFERLNKGLYSTLLLLDPPISDRRVFKGGINENSTSDEFV